MKNLSRVAVSLIISIGWLLSGVGQTEAGVRCERVAADLVELDGLLDDWRGIRGRTVRGGGSAKDASFTVKCGYDGKRLYLMVDIRDERVLRGKKARAKSDDHLDIKLSVGKQSTGLLRLFPGTDKGAPTRTFAGRRPPRWLAVEDSLQRRGWAAEIAMPLSRIRGLSRSAPGVSAEIVYRDADLASEGKIQDTVTFRDLLEIGDAGAAYKSFLSSAGLTARDVRLDVTANVDGSPGAERIVAGGAIIGVITDQFTYMTLPVQSAKDVQRVEVLDLRGDGVSSILAHYRQRGNGGSRDVVAVWNVNGRGGFDQLIAFEVRKQMGSKVLANRWSLAPKGKFRKGVRTSRKGKDIVIEVSERDAKGWDEDNYFEQPAPDAHPILTPWSDQTSAVYYFDGNVALGGDPKSGRR